MIKAYKVPEEHQQSPLSIYGNSIEEEYPGIIFSGNRNYGSHNSEMWKDAECTIEDLSYYFGEMEEAYESKEAAISDIAGCGTVSEWEAVIDKYESRSYDEAILDAVSIIAGRAYTSRTIVGCCQGDWQTIYYPEDDYSKKDIDRLEAEYFNTGDEWRVEDRNGEDVYCYTVGITDEERKQEIADEIGAEASEIVLMMISGRRVVYDYAAV